ncbi:hypothetical protein [Campylobacter sp. 19-13652]|uniref:hypothetical protein n=1 Tax=Campylobacter sp. 19-13652 TaxID=2840180 RepID=UPI001C74A3FD|nr:hypothetical protein [Campylobacter sp. 19-13652]BCX78880.1 membrane protein [Campylobacter sp. 19-13652]
MRAENFIAFFTVCGFFVGMVFSMFKSSTPLEMLVFSLLVTFFFYLISHIIIMNYIDTKKDAKDLFDKEHHEFVGDKLISELAVREKRMENLMLQVASENEKLTQVLGKKNARKAKAA